MEQKNDSVYFARGIELINANTTDSFGTVDYSKVKNRLDLLLLSPIEFIKCVVNESIDSGLWDEKVRNIQFSPLRSLAEVIVGRKKSGENSTEFGALKKKLHKLEEEKSKCDEKFLEIDHLIKEQIMISIDANIKMLDFDAKGNFDHQQRMESIKKVFEEDNKNASKVEEMDKTIKCLRNEIQQLKAEMNTQCKEEKDDEFGKLRNEIADLKNSISNISENEQNDINNLKELFLEKLNKIEKIYEEQISDVQNHEKNLLNQITLQNITIQQLENKKKETEEILKNIEQAIGDSGDKDGWEFDNIVLKVKLLQNRLNQFNENQKEIMENKKYTKELEDLIIEMNDSFQHYEKNDVPKDRNILELARSLKENISNEIQFLEGKIMEIDETFAHIEGEEAKSGIEISEHVKAIKERIQNQANKNIERERLKANKDKLEKDIIEISDMLNNTKENKSADEVDINDIIKLIKEQIQNQTNRNIESEQLKTIKDKFEKDIIEISDILNDIDGNKSEEEAELDDIIKSIKKRMRNLHPVVERGIELDGEAYHLEDSSEDEGKETNNITTENITNNTQMKEECEKLKSIVSDIYRAIYEKDIPDDELTDPNKLAKALQMLSEPRDQPCSQCNALLASGILTEKRFRFFSIFYFACILYLTFANRK